MKMFRTATEIEIAKKITEQYYHPFIPLTLKYIWLFKFTALTSWALKCVLKDQMVSIVWISKLQSFHIHDILNIIWLIDLYARDSN